MRRSRTFPTRVSRWTGRACAARWPTTWQSGPRSALATLDRVRKDILKTANARVFLVGSAATQQTLGAAVGTLVGELDRAPGRAECKYGTAKLVAAHLRERDSTAVDSALRRTAQSELAERRLPQLRAGRGHGRHRPRHAARLPRRHRLRRRRQPLHLHEDLGAGLAYSNGLGASPVTGACSTTPSARRSCRRRCSSSSTT